MDGHGLDEFKSMKRWVLKRNGGVGVASAILKGALSNILYQECIRKEESIICVCKGLFWSRW